MIPRVRDDDVTLLVDGNALRSQELPVGGTFRAEKASRLEVGMDGQQPVVVETYTALGIEVLPHGAFEAVFVDELAVGREQLHAMVTRVRHEDVAIAVHRHVPRVVELSVFAALLAELEQERSFERKHLHAVVVFIRNDDATLGVAHHSGRPIELAVARAS